MLAHHSLSFFLECWSRLQLQNWELPANHANQRESENNQKTHFIFSFIRDHWRYSRAKSDSAFVDWIDWASRHLTKPGSPELLFSHIACFSWFNWRLRFRRRRADFEFVGISMATDEPWRGLRW
jgi:hypothetical protein